MKTYLSGCLLLILVLALLTGCAGPAELPTEAPGETVFEVSSADEFLMALGSDRTIRLAPGTYDLASADGYLQNPEEGCYRWSDEDDSLVITGLQGLTIQGTGAELLSSGSRGQVLLFEDCRSLTLQDLTLSLQISGSMADTLVLRRCQDALLENLTLRDSGYSLLTLLGCQNVTVTGSHFTGSAASALSILGCGHVTVDSCEIRELGRLSEEKDPYMPDFRSLIQIGLWPNGEENFEVRDISLTHNTFRNNTAGLLAHISDGRKIYLTENTFIGNHMEEAAFCIWSAQPHIYGNTFEDNDPWLWYYPSSAMAVDENGADIPSELFYTETELPEAGEQSVVHVSTAQEFLNAIGPDTKILLDCPLLDLSTAPDYGEGRSEYYRWEPEYDGPVLVISQVNNLTISAESEVRTAHTISAVPRYADVLRFEFCTNVTLENLTCGHTLEPGFCMGGVLRFKDCRNTQVVNCGLYGCGILGVIAHGGEDLSILNSDIYECSDGGVSLVDVSGVTIENTTFRDLGGEALHLRHCKDAVMDGAPIPQK